MSHEKYTQYTSLIIVLAGLSCQTIALSGTADSQYFYNFLPFLLANNVNLKVKIQLRYSAVKEFEALGIINSLCNNQISSDVRKSKNKKSILDDRRQTQYCCCSISKCNTQFGAADHHYFQTRTDQQENIRTLLR